MRLRTLPVSVAGVLMACGLATLYGHFRPVPAAICLAVAVLAQIASNFANEYYDYRDGLDRPGREGPRRGVTEGDIRPKAMLTATYITLGLACALGCTLIYFGGWWMLAAGIAIAAGAIAYSAGPYPLSRHGLGEAAVIVFFGLAPVCLTFYLQSGFFSLPVVLASLSIGLMGANVLIVNNYRDIDADRAVGKRTLAVITGPAATRWLYLANGIAAMALMWPLWRQLPTAIFGIPAAYLLVLLAIWSAMKRMAGRRLTPLLGMTAMTMLVFALAFAIAALLISKPTTLL